MADQRTVWKVEIDQAKFMAGLKQMASGISTNAAAIDQLNKQTKTLGGRFKNSFAGQVGSVYLLQRAVRAVVGNMIQFGDKMAEIQAITKASASGFKRLTDTVRHLGATTRFTATEAANGMAFLARAGLTADQSIRALPGTLDLASAGFVDVGTAADFTVNVIKQFGLAVSESENIAGTFVYTANSTNTTVQQLGVTLQYAGSVAGVVGLEFEELAAAAGLLANAGIKGSRAGTQLRGIIATLLDPTKKARDTIEGLGLSIEELRPGFNEITGETVTLNDVFTKLEEAGFGAGEAVKIFRKRQLAGALVLAQFSGEAEKGRKTLKALTDEIRDNHGEAKKAAKIVEDTLGGAFRRLKSSIEAVNLTLADEGGFAGTLRTLVDTVAVFIRSMLGFENAAKGVSETAQLMASMLESLVLILILKGAGGLIGALGATIAKLGGLRLAFIAAMGSAGVLLAVVTALIGGLIYARKKAGEYSDAMDRASGQGKNIGKMRAAIQGLNKDWKDVTSKAKGYVEALRIVDKSLTDFLVGREMAFGWGEMKSEWDRTVDAIIAPPDLAGKESSDIWVAWAERNGRNAGRWFAQSFMHSWRSAEQLLGVEPKDLTYKEPSDYFPGIKKQGEAALLEAETLRVSLAHELAKVDLTPIAREWLDAATVEQNVASYRLMIRRIQHEVELFAGEQSKLLDPNRQKARALLSAGVDPDIGEDAAEAILKIENEREILLAKINGATEQHIEFLKIQQDMETVITGTEETALQKALKQLFVAREQNEEKEKEKELTKSIGDALTNTTKETDNLLARAKLLTKEEKELFDIVTSLGGKYEDLSFLQQILFLGALKTKNAFLEAKEANAAIASELKGAVKQVEDLEAELSGVALTARQLAERKVLNWEKGDQTEFEKLVTALEKILKLTEDIAHKKALDSFKKGTKDLEEQNELQQAIVAKNEELIVHLTAINALHRAGLTLNKETQADYDARVAAIKEDRKQREAAKKIPSETVGRSGKLRNQYAELTRSLNQQNFILQMQINGATEEELRLQEELFQLQNQGVAFNEEELRGLIENNERLKRTVDLSLQVKDTLSTGFADLFTTLVSGTENLSDALENFLRNMTQQLTNMFAQDFFKKLLGGGFGNPFGGGIPTVGGDTPYTYGSFTTGIPESAKGNAFSGGIRPFASGGIVKRPTYFAAGGTLGVMGEAGAEAILPLGRDAQGRLGVRGGGGTTVVMNISTPDADSFIRSKRQVASAANKAIRMGQQDQVRGVN